MTGRPFGGVAVMVRRKVCNIVTFCGSSSDGIKLKCQRFDMLIFGCYFPCTSVLDYSQQLGELCGWIESITMCHPGARLCVLGDLNFECDEHHLGFVTFSNFANEYGIVSCDDLIAGN